MPKPQPKEETILLEEEQDQITEITETLSDNDLFRLISSCGFLLLPLSTEDLRVNAPSSQEVH